MLTEGLFDSDGAPQQLPPEPHTSRWCIDRTWTSSTTRKPAPSSADNVMPHLIAAVSAYATLQECCDVMRQVFGAYTEAAVV